MDQQQASHPSVLGCETHGGPRLTTVVPTAQWHPLSGDSPLLLQASGGALGVRSPSWLALDPPRHGAWLLIHREMRLRSICEDIAEHPEELADMEVCAARAGVSARTLHRLFLRVCGMSAAMWIRRWQMMAGMRIMVQGAPVAHAAEAAGYRSKSAFNAMFQRSLGLSPQRYGTRTTR